MLVRSASSSVSSRACAARAGGRLQRKRAKPKRRKPSAAAYEKKRKAMPGARKRETKRFKQLQSLRDPQPHRAGPEVSTDAEDATAPRSASSNFERSWASPHQH